MPTLRRVWTPHTNQQPIMDSDARFRIIAAGRRFGKTEMCGHLCFEQALAEPERVVWWVAPTYEDANELGFDNLMKIIPKSLVKRSNRQSPRKIELVNDSIISFRSADREDSLRGRGVNFLVIDEAGSVPTRAWQEELRPSLSDTLGEMVAIGTPKGRNWFYDWWTRGDDPEYDYVDSFHFSSYDNPHVEDSEVESARMELPDRVFRQEYLAEFIDSEGAVFGPVRERNVTGVSPDDATGPYTIGVDLARTQNFTVVVALGANGVVAAFERLNMTSWDKIQRVVERVATAHSPNVIRLDATRDNKIVQDIEAAGFQVEPVRFSATTKRDMVENLAARLETVDITIPDMEKFDHLINELTQYEYDVTESGNIKYRAPAGFHDDAVDALALAAKKQMNQKAGVWGR